MLSQNPIPGRGAGGNPKNRFEEMEMTEDPDFVEEEPQRIKTRYFKDMSQTIITRNNSPDVGFEASLNPYRGCEPESPSESTSRRSFQA